MKRLLQGPAVQRLLAAWLARYLAFALRTTRWTLLGEEHIGDQLAGAPGVVAFWHERLPLMPMLWRMVRDRSTRDRSTGDRTAGDGGTRPPQRAHVLVSRHRDGRFIGDLMQRFDFDMVYGSSRRKGRDRGGASGVLAMLDLLAAGDFVAITPDGPRGPRRQAAPGVAQLAALSGVPVMPCAAQLRHRIHLNTWDRMVLPLPWGRGVVVCGATIAVPREDWEAALPAIATALDAAAARADAFCR